MSKHEAKGLRRSRRLAAALAAGGALLGLLGGAAPAQAAPMPAGTVIRSTATATYIPAGLAQAETVFSNELIATVQAVEALALTQDQAVTRPPSSTVVLSHLLANTGNVASSYTIALANNAGGCDADTLDLERLRVVHDINGNGVADAGEPEIPLHTAKGLALAPGESAALLAMGTVPGAASGQACVALSASTALQGLNGVNRDRVQVGSMAALSLTKSASYPGYIVPGETRIDFSVIGTNIGAQDARPSAVVAPADMPLRVNGSTAALVLLRDLVPAGTQYIAGTLQSAATGAVKLFRLPGDPPFSYRTVEDASAVEVAIGLPAPLARNASAAMQFAVRALASQSGEIRNTAQAYLHDGMQAALAESNTVVIANRASIGVAKAASQPRLLGGADGHPGEVAEVRFRLNVRNYGATWLHGVQVADVMEGAGASQFGSYTTAAMPAAGQFNIVAGSVAVVSSTSGGNALPNRAFRGTAEASKLLADGASLPPGGQLGIEFEARVNVAGRSTTLYNTAKASASMAPGGATVALDESVNGDNPDLNGDGNPANDSSPTPVAVEAPTLTLSNKASVPRRISPGVYQLDYTLTVTNTGKVPAPNVRVIENFNCVFEMDKPDGPIASWSLVGAPKSASGKLGMAKTFTGRAACNRDIYASDDPFRVPTEAALSLTSGSETLAPGQSEVLRLTVEVTEKPSVIGTRITLDNKAWAAAFAHNSVDMAGAQILAATAASANTLLVDPQGVVYNAATRQPVAGAVVTFTRQSCSAGAAGPITPQEIHASDSGLYTFNTNGSVSMATAADGAYQFYLLSPPVTGLCTYGLSVAPPAGSGYVAPSQLVPATAGAASCGAVVPGANAPRDADPTTHHFQVTAGVKPDGTACEAVHNHLPLDPGNVLGLVLRKDGSKRQAELGDFIDYALTVTNKTGFPITGLSLGDSLPPGFAYVAGSARLNAEATADPAGGAGPGLVFNYPALSLAPDQSAMVRYRVRIGVGAPAHGDAVNRARASAGPLQSNLASWTVRVTGGVFSDEAFAFGKVYLDCRRDGRQQGSDEIGVPGVRIYMEDGTHVVTDVEGKWSLYGLKPVTHVLRVDPTTLPRGARLDVLDNRNARSPDSRFVDLKKGEFHKANFVIGNCEDPAVVADVAARRAAIAAQPDTEAEAQVRLRLDPEGKVVPVGEVRSLPAAGQALASGSSGSLATQTAPLIALPVQPANASSFVNGGGGTMGGTLASAQGGRQAPLAPLAPQAATLAAGSLPAPRGAAPLLPQAAPGAIELDKLLPGMADNTLDFVELRDGDTVAGRTINVRVKGGDGNFRLTVNGAPVDERRVGIKARLPSKQLAAWEYIGVTLNPGANTLRLEAMDGFGNVRGAAREIAVTAPDSLASIELGLPEAARADLRTPAIVRVRLLDGAGVPVTARTQLTLETERGRWLAEDLNPAEPGTQVFMEGGVAEFALMPPGEPGDARIRVSAASFAAEGRLGFLPELRPMIGVGIVEGVLDLTSFTDSAWVRSGWSGTGSTYSSLSNTSATATQTQAINGVTPGALLTFTWGYANGTVNGAFSTLSASYGPAGAETVYWSSTLTQGTGGAGAVSAASNGAVCLSGCGTTPPNNPVIVIQLRLPAGIPMNGTLKFIGKGSGTGSPYISIIRPVSIQNTGICLAKTSLGSTGTFSFATSGVDTTMGGGGTTASVTTTAVNTTKYYDASGTRTNNQPLLITSPGATANVTLGETPASGFVLESVSCPGLSPTRTGNSITIANVPRDTTTTCTFTNRAPIINLSKALAANRFATGDNFSVAIRTGGANGTVVSSTAASTTSGSGSGIDAGTGTTGDFYTVPGTTYTLTESGVSGANLANYNATLTCTDSAGVTPAGSLPTNEAFDPAAGRAITPVTGANLRCVITNAARPRVSLQKAMGGAGRISASDQFVLSATGAGAPAAVTTSGSGINVTSPAYTFTATAGSSYTLGEAMAPGSASALSAYTQGVTCGNAGGPTNVSGITALPIGITPAAGDNISCVITNYPTTDPGGGTSPDPGPTPVCNGDPVIAGSDFGNSAWVRSGWTDLGSTFSSLKNVGTAKQTQAITGVTPGALLSFSWNFGNGTGSGTTATLTASYGATGAETVYWTGTVDNNNVASTGSSAAGSGAVCVSGCGSTPRDDHRSVQIRLPTGIPMNGTLKFTATGVGTGAPYVAVIRPVSIANTGICLAKTSLGATGTFNFTTSGVDTTMGGGGTTASITTAAVNTTRYYDASGTRTNNQPLLITSPGATANVTIGETPAAGYVLESVSCPGLSPVRSGNSVTIANVPRDTTTTCTFTNRAPIINLSKALAGNRLGAADQFSVAIRTGGVNGTAVSSSATATSTGSGSGIDAGTGTTGDFYTVPGTTYTLTEAGAGGANIANYKASLTCSDAAGVTPAASLPTNESFNPAIGRAITPVTGANLRCVITNSPGTPTVSGRVFLDNGQGGGTANDGILNGGEGPLAGVTLRLTNCASTVHATVQSDAAGGYSLPVPAGVASGAALCVDETNPGTRVSTGASAGATALPSGTATAVSGTSYTYTRTGTPDRIAFSWNGTGHANLNFGDVDNSTLAANGAKTGAPGNTVTYGHTFTAGTAGTVRYTIGTETPTPAGATGWSAQIFDDPACTGSLQPGAAQLYPPTGAGAAVAAAGTACIVVRQFIPAMATQGASNRLTVKAEFDYANAGPALSGSFTVEDTTTVSSTALDLRKEVRNVTQAGSFGVSNQAKSGETLEYRITYTNNSDQPISSMQISDTTPGYTTFVSATTGTTPATLTSCTKNTPANAQPAAAVPCTDAQAAGGTGPIDWRFVGSIAPGGTGSVLFRVKVD